MTEADLATVLSTVPGAATDIAFYWFLAQVYVPTLLFIGFFLAFKSFRSCVNQWEEEERRKKEEKRR